MSKIKSILTTKLLTAPSIFWDYEQALRDVDSVVGIFTSQKAADDFKNKHGKKRFLKASSVFVGSFLLDKKPRVNELIEILKEKESFLKRHWGKDKFNHLVFLLESFKASNEFILPEIKVEKGTGFLKKSGLLDHG